MNYPKPITPKAINKLTWRLLGGESRWFGPDWGRHGDLRIRDDYSRLYLVSAGEAEVRTDDKTYSLETDRFYLFPAGTAAFYSTTGMHLTWLHFNVYAQPGLDILQESTPPSSVVAQEDSFESFRQLLYNMQMGTPAGLSRACSIAARFVTPFLTCEWSDIFRRDEAGARVRSVVAYIHANLSSQLALADLARVAGVHPVYLSRIFKRATGIPPAKYVTAARMRHASDQLRLTGKRIAEIGVESGFDDPYHFSRAFKHFVGVAPKMYREARAAF